MNIIKREKLKETLLYDIWEEMINVMNQGKPVTLQTAYTKKGEYIGDVSTAVFICDEIGIKPECQPGHRVCNIGFNEAEQKWYGWSHRAYFGFGIGDEVKEGSCTNSPGWTDDYLTEHPEKDVSLPVGFKAKTLDDARRMAIAFADSVG